MKLLKQIYIEKDYYVFGLLLLSLFPIFDYGIISLTIGIFFITCLLTWCARGKPNIFTKHKLSLFFNLSGFYLLILLSVLYSDDFEYSIKTVVKQIPLMLFPLALVFIVDFTHLFRVKYRNLIFRSYTIGMLTLVTLIFILCLKISSKDLFSPGFLRGVMENFVPLDLHPSYVSFYLVIAIGILLDQIRSLENYALVLLKGIAILYFIVALFLMSSKALMLASVVALLLHILFINKASIGSKIIASFSILSLVLIILFSVPTLKARFETVYREFRLPNFSNPSTTPVRVGIYNCAFSLIENNLILGYGVGDVQTELNKCYEQYRTNHFRNKDFNTHNYFLYIILSTGIVGLLFFISTLVYHIQSSIKNEDRAYFTFIIVFFVFLLTENVLVRAYGIISYSFFSTVFVISNFKHSK